MKHLTSSCQRLRSRILARVFPLIFRPTRAVDMARLGSDYGGWWIPAGELDDKSICYCAGVGEDVSFDLALVQSYGCSVVSLDPTPKAVAFMASLRVPSRMRFMPVGISGSDCQARFYSPRDPAHASFSMANLQRTDTFIEAPVRTVHTLMGALGHSHVDLLKLDIEGAEYEVVASLLRDQIYPRTLCVEFDQPRPVVDTWRTVKRLRSIGYDIAHVERFNVTFLRALRRDCA